jgi:phosphopantetheine adenylyltransferase
MKLNQLLITHFVNLGHLSIGICGDELLNNHKSTSYSDDKLSIQNFRENLLSSKKIETISNLTDRNWTVSLVDIGCQHLIQ